MRSNFKTIDIQICGLRDILESGMSPIRKAIAAITLAGASLYPGRALSQDIHTREPIDKPASVWSQKRYQHPGGYYTGGISALPNIKAPEYLLHPVDSSTHLLSDTLSRIVGRDVFSEYSEISDNTQIGLSRDQFKSINKEVSRLVRLRDGTASEEDAIEKGKEIIKFFNASPHTSGRYTISAVNLKILDDFFFEEESQEEERRKIESGKGRKPHLAKVPFPKIAFGQYNPERWRGGKFDAKSNAIRSFFEENSLLIDVVPIKSPGGEKGLYNVVLKGDLFFEFDELLLKNIYHSAAVRSTITREELDSLQDQIDRSISKEHMSRVKGSGDNAAYIFAGSLEAIDDLIYAIEQQEKENAPTLFEKEPIR